MKDQIYDVAVLGAGVAGIAAALAARRNGSRTLLVEKECLPGGLATLGLITYYLPLCDGMGHQMITGISEELLRLSIRYGCDERYPAPWLTGGSAQDKARMRFEARFNPQWFALLAEQLLVAAGVDILYDSRFINVQAENGRIAWVEVANKGGVEKISARAFVDATGDADVAALSGEGTCTFEDNRPAAWYYMLDEGQAALRMMGLADIQPGGQMVKSFAQYDRFTGLDPWQNSDALIRGHAQILSDLAAQRRRNPSIAPITLPTVLQIRMSRRLDGAFTMHDPDQRTVPDSIGVMGSWRQAGPAWELPYRCLHGTKIENLLVAGRCISAAGAMWDLTRVIPVAALTGQGAGTAASLMARSQTPAWALDTKALQKALTQAGVRLTL